MCDQAMSLDINDLPQEITALVFKNIPFSSIGQCRAVCKEWNSLIMDPEFSCQFGEPDFPKPMLVANDPVEGWSISVHNSESDLWVPVSLPFLQDAPQTRPLYLTASSGGLMCFETHDRRSFIICNPVTRKWRHLQLPVAEDDFDRRTCSCLNPLCCRHNFTEPHTPDVLTTLTGLIVNKQAGSYKLVVASLAESRERRTFVFNSSTLSWTRGAQVPMGSKFLNPVALTLDHNLYCLLGSDAGKRVAKYDAELDSWCCSNPLVRDIVPFFHGGMELELVEHNDGVKVLARDVGRAYGYRHFYPPPIRRGFSDVKVLSVLESPGRIEVRGQWHGRRDRSDLDIKNRLNDAYRYTGGGEFYTMASAASASYAGHGKTLYVLGVVDFWNEACMFHVLKVDCCSDRPSLLASFGTRDFQQTFGFSKKANCQTQVELRLFQPSLVAQV